MLPRTGTQDSERLREDPATASCCATEMGQVAVVPTPTLPGSPFVLANGDAVTSIQSILTEKKGGPLPATWQFSPNSDQPSSPNITWERNKKSKKKKKRSRNRSPKRVAAPYPSFRSFITWGLLGINRADTDGWTGSMELASNLGKVAVRPCKLPCWESREKPPLPYRRSFDKKPHASPFPPPTRHEIQFGFSSPSLLLPREESSRMPGEKLQLPGNGHLARG